MDVLYPQVKTKAIPMGKKIGKFSQKDATGYVRKDDVARDGAKAGISTRVKKPAVAG